MLEKTKVDSGLVSALPDISVTETLSQNENRPISESENSTKTISDADTAAVRDSETNSGKERVSSVSASYPDTSQHANDLGPRYQCDLCKITYKQLKSLKNHICNKKIVKIPCPSCSKMISKSNLSHHIKTHSAIKHKCHKCKKIFRRKELLDKHILKHGRKKKTLCEQCGKVFARPNHLKAHMISHAKQQEDGPSEEVNALQKEIKCKICSNKFPSTSQLTVHLKKSHPEVSVKCKVCNKTFFSKRGLAAHERTHGIAPNMPSDKNDPKTEDTASENAPKEVTVGDDLDNLKKLLQMEFLT